MVKEERDRLRGDKREMRSRFLVNDLKEEKMHDTWKDEGGKIFSRLQTLGMKVESSRIR